jgi:hypothetical protein
VRVILVRDERRMEKKPAVLVSRNTSICRQFYGSDGTRTRDLRRDRPVMALAAWAGIGGDYRQEQGFPMGPVRGLAGAGGDLREPRAGSARDATLPYQKTESSVGARAVLVRSRTLPQRLERLFMVAEPLFDPSLPYRGPGNRIQL